MDSLLQGRVGLFVRLSAKPGSRAAVLDVLHRYVDRLEVDEPGTEAFMLLLDPDDENLVWLHEWFVDEAAQSAHQSSPAFAELMSELPQHLVSQPAVLRVDPLRVHLNPQASQPDTIDEEFEGL